MDAQKWLKAAIVSSLCVTLASAADCTATTATTTLSSKADATSLVKACKSYSGTIAIATGVSGDFSLEKVERSSIDISNTDISSLDGLASDGVYENITIASNKDLKKIEIEGTHAGTIVIGSNSDDVEISFPHLKEAEDIEIANASSIDLSAMESLPRGGIHILGGDLEELDLEALTEAMGGLILEDLPKLTKLSAPEFTRVQDEGSLSISNTGLTELSLPKLQLIFDSLWLEGDFDKVDLPLLNHVGGNIYMKGSKDFDCDDFESKFKKLAAEKGQTFKCVTGGDDDSSSKSDDTEVEKPSRNTSTAITSASSSASKASSSSSSSASGSAAASATGSSSASTFGTAMMTTAGLVGLVSFLLL